MFHALRASEDHDHLIQILAGVLINETEAVIIVIVDKIIRAIEPNDSASDDILGDFDF